MQKRRFLPHFWSDKDFKGTVVNQTLPSLHEGSLPFFSFLFPLIKILSVCIISPDSFSGYYEKRGRADGTEGPDYGPEGRFSGPQAHKDMFYGPLARKHDQKFIQMVDRAFELYRVSLNLIW